MTLVPRVVRLLLVAALCISACSRPAPPLPAAHTVVLLSRDGCMMTPAFQKNLDEAIHALGRPVQYDVIDLGTVARTDPRVAFPTPTLLIVGRDAFGLPEPVPPFPEPT